MKLLLIFVVCCINLTQVYAQSVSGLITGEETWSGTIFLKGDVTVTETGSLSILAGTRIECDPQFDDLLGGLDLSRIEILIEGGTLRAEGTQAAPIIFSSADLVPSSDDWYGIRIRSDKVTMKYCTVEYANIGLTIEQNGLPTVEHCIFHENKTDGVKIETPDTYIFTSCRIVNNGGYGILSTSADKGELVLTDMPKLP